MKTIFLLIFIIFTTLNCNENNDKSSISETELEDLNLKYIQYYSIEDSLKSLQLEIEAKQSTQELNYLNLLIQVRLNEYKEALNLINSGDVFPKEMNKFQTQLITGYLTEIVNGQEDAKKYYSQSLSIISDLKSKNDLHESFYLLLAWLESDNDNDKKELNSFVNKSNEITILENQPEIEDRYIFIKEHLPEML